MEPYLFREMLIGLANELRRSDNDSDSASEDHKDGGAALGLLAPDEYSTTNENNKNDEYNEILELSEKNK